MEMSHLETLERMLIVLLSVEVDSEVWLGAEARTWAVDEAKSELKAIENDIRLLKNSRTVTNAVMIGLRVRSRHTFDELTTRLNVLETHANNKIEADRDGAGNWAYVLSQVKHLRGNLGSNLYDGS